MPRTLGLALLLFAVFSGAAIAAWFLLMPDRGNASDVVLYKHPQCGCCSAWAAHMRSAGFDVQEKMQPDAQRRWKQHDIPADIGSCHTAVVDGYVIEGHVPAKDVRRLLREKPDAIGLVVPGMPIGSPGMEGSDPEAYDVLLLKRDGTTEIFSHHEPGR